MGRVSAAEAQCALAAAADSSRPDRSRWWGPAAVQAQAGAPSLLHTAQPQLASALSSELRIYLHTHCSSNIYVGASIRRQVSISEGAIGPAYHSVDSECE